jgi:DNA-binding response OmpR family regulator
MSKILMVEDDPQIQAVNRNMLTRRGYDVLCAMNLAEARGLLENDPPDAVVLDIMLPDGSGLDFLRELRKNGDDTPVLLLTALSKDSDVVRGLESGGDDYLPKPYNYDVLAARVDALMRRRGMAVPVRSIEKGGLTLDLIAGRAFVNGEDLLLKLWFRINP